MSIQLRRHIALVGFMGCGKSTIGPLLAQALGRGFLDTDRAVEEMVGASIPEIFAREGEEAFRQYETRALQLALARSPRVIATGGGLVVRPENRTLLQKKSTTVWLRVPMDTLLDRLTKEGDRPLLRDDPGFKRTRALYAARESLYKQASIRIDASVSPTRVVRAIMTELQRGG